MWKINKFVGEKIYSLRLARGLSRIQLSKHIDISHQQLSKYENGKDRITSGQLALIAKALSQEILYFFEGLEAPNNEFIVTQHQRMCLEISRNFMQINDLEHRDLVNLLIKSLIKS
jgi:transcriptional regulator with XRE-family HTH domain